MLNPVCCRVLAPEHAPGGPFRVLERRHGLAEIVDGGAVVYMEGQRIIRPHREREVITLTENAPPHENIFAQHRPGFFKAPHLEKGARVVVGFCESVFMFFAVEFQSSGVYVSLQP